MPHSLPRLYVLIYRNGAYPTELLVVLGKGCRQRSEVLSYTIDHLHPEAGPAGIICVRRNSSCQTVTATLPWPASAPTFNHYLLKPLPNCQNKLPIQALQLTNGSNRPYEAHY